ncbi:MAG: TRAP transporter large permease subunit [Treponema sp.]|nr:TRAP transporter large permease subunit [Treponema sp.]
MDDTKPIIKEPIIWKIEEGICYLFIALLALLPASEAVARLLLRTGVPSSADLTVHFLLVLGLLSGMITTRQKQHLSINIVDLLPSQKAKNIIAVFTSLISVFTVTVLVWCGASFVSIALSPWTMIGFIPDQVFAWIIPVGFAVMAFRFARLTPVKGKLRILPVLTIIAATVCSLPVIAKFIWGFNPPDFTYSMQDFISNLAFNIKIPAAIFLIFAALAGAPLFIIMGAIALIMIQGSWGEIDVVANQVYTGLTMNSYVAIPLFTITGFFLSESKAGERLVRVFRSLFAWIPGGMIIATVLICAFFTSFTGASGVTILALGGLLYVILSDHAKYPSKFSIGFLTSAGSIGLLFPPSLPIILVGAKTQTNIIHLFLGGIFPGLLLIATVIIFGIVVSLRVKIPVEPFNLRKSLDELKDSAFEILLPILLIAGYFTGILSLVEIGAAAMIYVFVVEVFIHRDIKIRDVPKVLDKAIPIIGGILSILALSQALSYFIIDTQVPENLTRWMQSAFQSKFIFLLVLNLALLIVGCLMDIFSAILIVLPLIFPLGMAYGIDPVHLGIIFIVNLEVGYLTPPVGMNLFLAAYRFNKPFIEICRDVMPFVLIRLVVVLLVTYIPALSTFLPGMVK